MSDRKPLVITPDKWGEASGSFVTDEFNQLWQIVGFIDRPAVLLRAIPMPDETTLAETVKARPVDITVVMGTPNSAQFTRLIPES